MSLLLDKVRTSLAKSKDEPTESFTSIGFPTGLDILDYLNGQVIRPKEGKPYYSLGIPEGSMIQIVGPSHSGKTSFAIKIAGYIASKFENSEVIYDDLEGGMSETRFMNLTNWDYDMMREKFFRRDKGIYAEQFKKNVMKIYKMKKEMKDDIIYDTGKLDFWGRPIKTYPPTLYVLDSLAMLTPEDLKDEEDLANNMIYAKIAKTNSEIFTTISPHLREVNIILILINHVSTKIDVSAYAYKPPTLNYLGQDENIPGGKKALYLSNNIIKIVAGAQLKPDDGYGIKGFKTRVELLKSRSAPAGTKMSVIFDQVHGYNNDLTNLEFLKDNDLLKGTGRGYFIEPIPDVKFTRKEFVNTLEENPEFKKTFNKYVKSMYKKMIPDPGKSFSNSNEEENEEEVKTTKKKKKKTSSEDEE